MRLRLIPVAATTAVIFGSGILLTEAARQLVVTFPPSDFVVRTFELYMARSSPALLIWMLVLGPVVEETIFRGGVLRYFLIDRPPARALWFSALIFSLIHVNVLQCIAALWLGLVLGRIYVSTRSIWPGVAAHALWNAQWLVPPTLGFAIPGYTLSMRDGAETAQPLWWLATGAALLAVGAPYFLRAFPLSRTDREHEHSALNATPSPERRAGESPP